jgi:hypothetical protein
VIGGNIDASGANGGGTVLIGGDYQGKGIVPNATRTLVNSDSVINADSLLDGDGGRVIVWANDITGFYGSISAGGGINSGNGGFVEVSGKQDLIFDGTANLNAPNGNAGTLLLDPTDITISNAPSSPGVDAQLTQTSQILQNDFSPVPGAITISQTTLEGLPSTANVLIEATNDITIGTLTGNQLTFIPDGNGGSITFRADADDNGVGSFSMDTTQSLRASGRAVTISGAIVTVGDIDTSFAGSSGGAITVTATDGNLTTGNLLTTGIQGGSGGAISLNATTGNITTGTLTTRSTGSVGSGSGGTISLNAVNGSIRTNNLDSSASATQFIGNGGNVLLNAGNGITINGDVNSSTGGGSAQVQGDGGTITLNSIGGSIDTSNAPLNSSSANGNGGAIALQAQGNITTNAINTASVINNQAGNGTGGAISLTSTGGAIDTSLGTLASFGQTAGAIALDAAGDVTTAQLDSGAGITGGDVTVTSRQGGIDTSRGIINPNTGSGTSGAVTLNANLDIVTGEIRATALTGNGNDITLTSTSGSINTTAADLNTSSGDGNAGKISLSALGNITTSALVSFSNAGNAGIITLSATNGQIATGNITAISPTQTGDISITGNEINFTGTANSVNSNGNLLLQPGTLNQNIAIANWLLIAARIP